MTYVKSVSGADYAATMLRVSLGIMYLAHAYLKIFVFTLPGAARFFESAGFPGWTVYPVVSAEVIGGVMLILGIQARWVALALIPILLGAVMTHWPNGWVFSAKGGGWEYPAFLIIMSSALALIGNGAFASQRTASASR
ncbi:MAG: DoxX family protein [Burkholderiales bacterium]